jgi:hypothetical protein
MTLRITLGVLLLVAAVLTPWWVTMLIAVILTCYFPKYYEVVVAGLVMDVVYGAATPTFFHFQFVFTVFFALLLFIIEYGKTKIRVYETI